MTPRIHHLKKTVQTAIGQSSAVRCIEIEDGALSRVPALLRKHFSSARAFIVADENTMLAAGLRLKAVLDNANIDSQLHVFPGQPTVKAKVESADLFLARLKASQAVPISIGSGVINDLVKYAAFQLQTPYLSIATAASMDGYASAGSSLSQAGFKHTIACAPPRVIVADAEVISQAPKEMSAWGYGDLAGKIPAGADWIIAHTLGIEKIDEAAWQMTQQELPAWLEDAPLLATGDPGAIMTILTGLSLVGIAMELHNSSRPASGAEHQLAHVWEMDGLAFGGRPVSHGTCVALATLTMLALYEWLLSKDLHRLDISAVLRKRRPLDEVRREVEQTFSNPGIARRALKEVEAKFSTDDGLEERLISIQRHWPLLKQRLQRQLFSVQKMRRMLAAAGVTTDPAKVGITPDYHKKTLIAARLIRRRYTVLDLLDDTGCFDEAVESIFAGGGRWVS